MTAMLQRQTTDTWTIGAPRLLAVSQRPDAQRFRVHVVEGGFVSGEARAVLRSIRGGPSLPPGGYHGRWHDPSVAMLLSRAGLGQIGGTLGAGVVIVLDHDTCGLGELAQAASWLADESAKQCGPCHFGLPALANDVARLVDGQASDPRLANGHAHAVTGRGACTHPDGAARFVVSGLRLLTEEIARHQRGGCARQVLGQLPLGRRS